MNILRSVVHDLKAVLMPYLLPVLNFSAMPAAYVINAGFLLRCVIISLSVFHFFLC